ncbi:MAG: hypothetical protein IPO94_12500 [Saprospiraceae bacterium]|nr:hypothetical protein [Saprospiraceae bacterium]
MTAISPGLFELASTAVVIAGLIQLILGFWVREVYPIISLRRHRRYVGRYLLSFLKQIPHAFVVTTEMHWSTP